MKFKFDDIAINSTKKKIPEESDKNVYIGLEHIDSESFTITRWGAEAAPIGDKLLMRKGDVLFGKRRAYQRKVAIAPFDGIFSAHGMVLRPKENVVTKDFFPFFISSDQFMERAVRISVGGLSPTVNWKDLKEQEFELPSIEEQKVLAEKLWAAYRLKESYKKLLAATDEMVKSRFIEMFGMESLQVPLADVIIVKDNLRKPLNDGTRSAMKQGDLYPYYGATGVVDYINDYLTDEELLCIAEDCGDYDAGAASSYLINGKAWVNNHAHLVKVKETICNIKYLHQYLKMIDLNPYVSGTTRKKLTQSKMLQIPVILPSKDKQDAFVLLTEQADKSGFVASKSRFIEMFGTTHSPKYEVSTLGIECRFKSGTTMPVEDELDAGDFVYAKVSDMNLDGNEIGITHSKKYLSKASAKNTWLPAGTVVFPKRGAAIYTNKKRVLVSDSCVDLNIIGVIPGSRLSSKYLYSFFKSLDLKDIADNSGIPQINNKHLVPLEIVVPPLETQYAFISFLEQADKSGFELRKSIENIDSVIKSLINN